MEPLNDLKFRVLSGMGYTGSINEMEWQFWSNYQSGGGGVEIPTGPPYSITLVNTKRSFDEEAATQSDITSVLATLITDLQNKGILE